MLTVVLMPWEKGRSWMSAGTKLRVSRAEQKVVEPAGVQTSKRKDFRTIVLHIYD